MDDLHRARAMRLSLIDGAFASVMSALTGGVFLTGFAVQVLHANPKQIGLLAALPTLATLSLFLGSYLIETVITRKTLCVICVSLSRLLWLGIVLLPLPLFENVDPWRLWGLIAMMAVTSLLGNLGHAGWLSWMGELVPEAARGTYFGKRNMVIAGVGVIATLAGGFFLSTWNQRLAPNNPYGFVVLFSVGGLAGLISAGLLARIPAPDDPFRSNGPFNIAIFLQPFSDPNFRRLIGVVAGWTFAIQLAAPFYTLFMIEHLQLRYMTMTIFTTVATLALALMMRIWGPLADKFGNKPVIILANAVLIVVPAIWLFAWPQAYGVALTLAHICSGAALAGATLSHFNISMKLSPPANRSVYLAAFTTVVGVIGGLAPIVGGYLSEGLSSLRFEVGGYELTRFQIIFLISAGLQVLIFPGFLKLQEVGAASPVVVIVQLQNDLNPQAGIASALDVTMLELDQARDMLDDFDTLTDVWADHSERKVARVLDTMLHPLKKVRKALWPDE